MRWTANASTEQGVGDHVLSALSSMYSLHWARPLCVLVTQQMDVVRPLSIQLEVSPRPENHFHRLLRDPHDSAIHVA